MRVQFCFCIYPVSFLLLNRPLGFIPSICVCWFAWVCPRVRPAILGIVGANHLVHGVYTSFALVVEGDHFCFFLCAIFIHHFVVVHHAQKHNSLPLLSDIADHGNTAIESKLCAVNLPGLGSLHQRRDVWLVLS